MPGNCDSYSERFIAEIVSAQTTYRVSRFKIKEPKEPHYYPYQ